MSKFSKNNSHQTVAPLLERLGRIAALIDTEPEAAALARLRAAETTGRPLGGFVTRLETLTQRRPRPRAPGRKPDMSADTDDLFAGIRRDGLKQVS